MGYVQCINWKEMDIWSKKIRKWNKKDYSLALQIWVEEVCGTNLRSEILNIDTMIIR
jgi:hypothetical protein